MRDSVRRLAGVVVLAVLFVGMMGHYGAVAPDHEETQRSLETLRTMSAADVGTDVYFWGVVERADDSMVVRVADQSLAVVSSDVTPRPGDRVQVDGTIESVGTVSADRVVVSRRSRLRHLYVVSAVALAVTVVVFFRFWTVDADRLAFVARDGGDDA